MNKHCKVNFAAAAASILASGSSQAAVIYSGPVIRSASPGDTQNFDLNGDSVDDFTVTYANDNANKPRIGQTAGLSQVRTQDDDGLPVTGSGVTVGFSDLLVPNNTGFFEQDFGGNTVGDWGDDATGFVGLQLNNGADSNFGWARFNYDDNGDATSLLTLVDFAYETTANQGITTGVIPEVSTFGLLILGAAGASARRRRKA